MPKDGPSATHAEVNRLNRVVQELTERVATTEKELEIQFKRIADMQAELDLVRAAWHTKPRPSCPPVR